MTAPPFAGHNIRLADGSETLPGTPLIAENGITQAALRMLSVCLPLRHGERRPLVADLGCLEGGYAVAFARAGYQVVGWEARESNHAKCVHVQQRTEPLPLLFTRGDVRDLEASGTFDAVFCAGLLYHLDAPDEFLRMLGRVTARLLIVQTHFATWTDTVHEGRRGHWYADNPQEADPFGSHVNPQSFWMAPEDLMQAIRDAGFGVVLRQYDYLESIVDGPQGIAHPLNPCGGSDRGMFIGIKP